MSHAMPQRPRIAVLGDLILDQYTYGDISRLSPEAPVPILEVKRREQRLGGAGNVALNLMALDCECVIFGRLSKDLFGKVLRSELKACKAKTHQLLESNLPTITKNRMVARNQQVMHIEEGSVQHTTSDEEQKITSSFLKEVDCLSAVILSDFGKGFLTDNLLKTIISICNERSLKVIVSPKGYDFSRYRGVTTMTLNLNEAQLAAPHSRTLKSIAESLIQQADLNVLLLTRSEEGISHFHYHDGELKHEHHPVQPQDVTDVTGAGDTVVAVAALGMAMGWDAQTTCKACNLAAGRVVGQFGAATIPRTLLNELMASPT
jgi:D-beta-D-heptose 7-phosphate kinase/D-beta-D-heptose 1-phosphate adenosyltransferase